MQTVWNDNLVLLRGEAAAAPRPSHENHGVTYQVFPLRVRRLSGAEDVLNVVAPEELLARSPVAAGARLGVSGEVRSYNNRTGPGSRLVITVYARTLDGGDGGDENLVTLSGTLCKPPVLRRTPLGREICDLMLAVNRRYGRADYLPCIAWGALARQCADLGVGDALRLRGRLQSRVYLKQLPDGPERRTAFEISVMELDDGDGRS
jgi:hypothetical protein